MHLGAGDQALLEPGRDDRAGVVVGGCPLGGVDERACRLRARRHRERVAVGGPQPRGAVHHNADGWVHDPAEHRHQNVDRRANVALQPGHLKCGGAGQQTVGCQDGDPAPLRPCQLAGGGHIDRPVGPLPTGRLEPVAQRLLGQPPHRLPARDHIMLAEQQMIELGRVVGGREPVQLMHSDSVRAAGRLRPPRNKICG